MVWIRRHLKLIVYVAFVLLVLSQIAATGQATALAIASAVALVAPFVLKLVPQAGRYMLVITWVASALIAIVAEVISGDIKFNPLPSDPGALYLLFGYSFGVTQAVFAFFKD